MDGPIQPRTAIMRAAMALCAGSALFIGAAAAASAQSIPAPAAMAQPVIAQSSPAPQASPAGQTNPAPGASQGTPNSGGSHQTSQAPPLGHMPIIDIVGTFTQPAYYGSSANIKGFDPIDIGGTVRFPVTRKLSLYFDRITEGTLNQPLECELVPPTGAKVCPNDSRDVILQYHGTYQFDRHWALDVGDSFRHREWNSGASGVSSVPFLCNGNGTATGPNCTVSSTEHHYGYAGLNYTTSPINELFHSVFTFSLTGDAQNVDHHVAALCSAGNKATWVNNGLPASCGTLPASAVGYYDENPHQSVYYESTQGVTWIVPVDPKHGTSFLMNERWGALNFYENASAFGGIGVPYRWNSAFTYQINKRFSPGFTLSVRHADYHAIPGMALALPNAIHVGSWDVIGTFHVDTNSWFH
jgi:hypothetical protein